MKRYLFVLMAGLFAAALATVAPDVNSATARAADVSGNPVILAVGDMACDQSDSHFNGNAGTASNCAQQRVSNQMMADASGYEAVLGLGDYQYDCGDLADYQVSYNPTYGRFDNIMDPSVGNHEYKTGADAYGRQCPTTNSTAQAYFNHFGAAAHPESNGHYSFDLGTWHFIALNANCSNQNVGGCKATSAQTTWLNADLASVDRVAQPCVAAYWHQPLFTGHKNAAIYTAWWQALNDAHADVVLNGHIHNYQRFAPLNPSGNSDPVNGITEYVVGTGGEALTGVSKTASPQPLAQAVTFGYLRMTLLPAGWTANFVNSAGTVLDTSAGTCHI